METSSSSSSSSSSSAAPATVSARVEAEILADLPKAIETQLDKTLVAKVRKDKWDVESWMLLIKSLMGIKSPENTRIVYEQFLSIFPTCGKVWCQYFESEIENRQQVESIFLRALPVCHSIDLWIYYIAYIKKNNTGLKQVQDALEHALNQTSHDVNCAPIWLEYIRFHRDNSEHKAGTDELFTHCRLLFERAFTFPLGNFSAIQEEYLQFISQYPPDKQRQFKNHYDDSVKDKRGVFQHAKLRKVRYRDTDPGLLSLPPDKCTQKELRQAKIWRSVIEWEKTNQPIPKGEAKTVERFETIEQIDTVCYTYNLALTHFSHFPSFWIEFANYLLSKDRVQVAINTYNRAIAANPTCLLLYFSFCEYYETAKLPNKSKEVYDQMIENSREPLALIHYMLFLFRNEGEKSAMKFFVQNMKQPHASYHFFVVAALLEYFNSSRDPLNVATSIFRKALEKFPKDSNLYREYITFLYSIKDRQNAESAFKSALGALVPDQTRELWDTSNDYKVINERSIANIISFSQERRDVLNEADFPMLSIIHRYKFKDLWPCDFATTETYRLHMVPMEKDKGRRGKSGHGAQGSASGSATSRYPMPQLSNMIHLQSEINELNAQPMQSKNPYYHTVSLDNDRIFPMNATIDDTRLFTIPSAIQNFISRLPSTTNFSKDPTKMLNVDRLFAKLIEIQPINLSDRKRKFDHRESDAEPPTKHRKVESDAFIESQKRTKKKRT